MRNVYIRITKKIINILLNEDCKSSFLFFPPEIFMPVYFSFFLALSLIIFENLVFSFFPLFFLHFFFLSFLFILLFICSSFPNPLIFQIKNRHSLAVTIFVCIFLFRFFLLIFPESLFFFDIIQGNFIVFSAHLCTFLTKLFDSLFKSHILFFFRFFQFFQKFR